MIVQCLKCKGLWSKDQMATNTLCVKCEAIEWLEKKGGEIHKKEKPTQQGDKGLPMPGERVTKTDAPKGQISLPL